MYAEGVDGILLEGDLVRSQRLERGQVRARRPTIFNHNVYIQARSDHFVARGNIFANASSHGLQARAGGDGQDNVFLNNPIGLTTGWSTARARPTPAGSFGRVTDNVFIGGRDISGQPRGIGMEIGQHRRPARTPRSTTTCS